MADGNGHHGPGVPAEATGSVAGMVLAAGGSRRLGRNKLLVEIDDTSLLRRAVRAQLDAGSAPVIAVLGFEAERAEAELADLPCEPVVNERWEEGIGTSLRAGIAALPATAVAAIVTLADMPRVTAGMIAELAAAHRRSSPPLVVSDYDGVAAPPTLYDRSLFPVILATTGCGRDVVAAYRRRATVLSWPRAALQDVDHPADLELVGAG